MKYSVYPDVRGLHPELNGEELIVASHLKLIEDIQRDLWGMPTNDGKILNPMDTQLMINWIGGGIFQYSSGGNVITASFALSRPDGNQGPDEAGITYSGCGLEYFVESKCHANWTVNLMVNIAKYIYSKPSNFLFEGMFVPPTSGYIPEGSPSSGLGMLCVKRHEIEMPDGRVDYLQLVPMTTNMIDEYKNLGADKASLATLWFNERHNNLVFPG